MLDGLDADRRRAPSSAASPRCARPARASTTIELPRARRDRRDQRQRRLLRRRELGLAPHAARRARRDYDPRVAAAHPPRRGDERGRLHRPARTRGATGSPAWTRRCAASTRCSRPTVPIVAPPLAPLVASDDAFFATNAPAAAQPLDRQPARRLRLSACPATRDGELPVGLMVWQRRLRDDAVLDAGAGDRSRARRRAATRADMRVAVIGAGIDRRDDGVRARAPTATRSTVFERRGTRRRRDELRQRRRGRARATSRPGRRPACRARCCATCSREHAPVRIGGRLDAGDARLAVALVARLPAARPTAPTGRACIASRTSAASGCTS